MCKSIGAFDLLSNIHETEPAHKLVKSAFKNKCPASHVFAKTFFQFNVFTVYQQCNITLEADRIYVKLLTNARTSFKSF